MKDSGQKKPPIPTAEEKKRLQDEISRLDQAILNEYARLGKAVTELSDSRAAKINALVDRLIEHKEILRKLEERQRHRRC